MMPVFCRRGRQNLRELISEDFGIGTDWYDIRYVNKVKNELTKKRSENESRNTNYVRNRNFILGSFFISQLNRKNEYLFRRPRKYS